MDNRNKSITLDKLTSFDVNKAIQRSLTKACARHGLGLYIYAGEDLPEEEAKQAKSDMEQKIAKAVAAMRAVKSREELEQVWRTWSNQIPCADGTEFNKATREMAQQFPNPQ